MVVNLTPALSFGSTSFNSNVIPIKPPKSDARVVNFTGNDEFVNKNRPADVSFGMKTPGKIAKGGAGILIALKLLTGCIDSHIPEVKVATKPIEKLTSWFGETLGISMTKSKSTKPITKLILDDGIAGAGGTETIILDEASLATDTIRGTINFNYKGFDQGTDNIKIFNTKDGEGLVKETSRNGKKSIPLCEYKEAKSENAIDQFIDGELRYKLKSTEKSDSIAVEFWHGAEKSPTTTSIKVLEIF